MFAERASSTSLDKLNCFVAKKLKIPEHYVLCCSRWEEILSGRIGAARLQKMTQWVKTLAGGFGLVLEAILSSWSPTVGVMILLVAVLCLTIREYL